MVDDACWYEGTLFDGGMFANVYTTGFSEVKAKKEEASCCCCRVTMIPIAGSF